MSYNQSTELQLDDWLVRQSGCAVDMTLGTLQGKATFAVPETGTNLTYQPGLFLTHLPGPYPLEFTSVPTVFSVV